MHHQWHHLHVNMEPLTVEDWLLIKTLQIKNGWTADRMIAEFPARQCIRHFGTLFSTWCIVRRSRMLTIWNKSWTVAGTWSAKNWSTVLLTSGLNDSYSTIAPWPYHTLIRRVHVPARSFSRRTYGASLLTVQCLLVPNMLVGTVTKAPGRAVATGREVRESGREWESTPFVFSSSSFTSLFNSFEHAFRHDAINPAIVRTFYYNVTAIPSPRCVRSSRQRTSQTRRSPALM